MYSPYKKLGSDLGLIDDDFRSKTIQQPTAPSQPPPPSLPSPNTGPAAPRVTQDTPSGGPGGPRSPSPGQVGTTPPAPQVGASDQVRGPTPPPQIQPVEQARPIPGFQAGPAGYRGSGAYYNLQQFLANSGDAGQRMNNEAHDVFDAQRRNALGKPPQAFDRVVKDQGLWDTPSGKEAYLSQMHPGNTPGGNRLDAFAAGFGHMAPLDPYSELRSKIFPDSTPHAAPDAVSNINPPGGPITSPWNKNAQARSPWDKNPQQPVDPVEAERRRLASLLGGI